MKITFILPGAGTAPIGGFKMVYRYADHLTHSGHKVTVVHTALVDSQSSSKLLLRKAFYMLRNMDKRWRPDTWYRHPLAEMIWVPDLSEKNIPDADIIVATEWRTAKHVAGYSGKKGLPFYFIQHWENWNGSNLEGAETWKLPLQKIVIAPWLQDLATNLGEPSEYIPNSVDSGAFGMDNPIENRNSKSLLMTYHSMDSKGGKDGLSVINQILWKHGDALITVFGTGPAPVKLPIQVQYVRNPSQSTLRSLYNNTSIFLTTSLSEGWGLPASEAMMCGAMVVGTDVGGHQAFMINGETALMAPPGDITHLTYQVSRSMTSKTLHDRIAHNGCNHIKSFSMDHSGARMETLFYEAINTKHEKEKMEIRP